MSEEKVGFHKVYAMYLKNVKKPNGSLTLQEFRYEMMTEMLDEFPLLRHRIKQYLKQIKK